MGNFTPLSDLERLTLTRQLTGLPPDVSHSRFPIEIIQGVGRSQTGALMVPGLIRNLSDRWIAVMLHVHLYDGAGKELHATNALGKPFTASALTATLPPHGYGPFMGYSDEADVAGKASSYRLSVFRAVEASRHPQARLENVAIQLGANAAVNGRYVNTGRESCLYPGVVGVGYTADGQIYCAELVELTDDEGMLLTELAPGAARDFHFEFLTVLETDALTRIEVFPAYDFKGDDHEPGN